MKERPDLLYHTSIDEREIMTHRTGRLDDIISDKSWGIGVKIEEREYEALTGAYNVVYRLDRREQSED